MGEEMRNERLEFGDWRMGIGMKNNLAKVES